MASFNLEINFAHKEVLELYANLAIIMDHFGHQNIHKVLQDIALLVKILI